MIAGTRYPVFHQIDYDAESWLGGWLKVMTFYHAEFRTEAIQTWRNATECLE